MPGSDQTHRVSLTVWGAAWVGILALPLLRSISSGKLLNFSGSVSPS